LLTKAATRRHSAPTSVDTRVPEIPIAPPSQPVVVGGVAAPAAASSAPLSASEPRDGRTHIEESFVVMASQATVWEALADFPAVAQCLPGAELIEHTADSVRGRLKVKIGPIAASFSGSATVQRDDRTYTAAVKGAGSDSLSRTRTRGDLTYRLLPGGTDRTRVTVALDYDLQGPLAQFARSNLARDLARRLMAEFAANLNAKLGVSAAELRPQAESLNAFRLFWQVLLQRLTALFRR